MLRRFESYGFAPDADDARRDELARVLRATGRYIPEVLDAAVGRNRSAVGVDLVWEHAYERPEAYARYMCHPFHICVLDRFLLPEHPECITASRRELALGLFGYEVDGAPFRAPAGAVRRIVVMRPRPDANPREVEAFVGGLGGPGDPDAGLWASVAAPNSMGLEWFPNGWTHVWERAFVDEAAMGDALAVDAARLAAGPMGEWADLWYTIEADDTDAAAPAAGAGRDAREGAVADAVLMIDDVVVAEADADAYVEAFERRYLPGARRRGLELRACWRSPAGIGEDVTVTTVLAVGTWAEWERARNAAVADPAVAEFVVARRALMRAGTRRFVTEGSGPDQS